MATISLTGDDGSTIVLSPPQSPAITLGGAILGPQGKPGADGQDGSSTITNTTPTSLTGILKGVGGLIASATAGSDYLLPTGSGSQLTGITESQISGLTSDLAGKQPLDSDLTAVAALTTTGMIARTGTGTFSARTITAGSSKLSVTNGDGVSGNPTLDVASIGGLITAGTNVTITGSGTVASPYSISSTGSGGGTTSPLTTKGDVWGYSTTNARIPIGSNNQVLTADSTQTLGLKWSTPITTFFNVKLYGAVGDGSHDDTSAIQSAINAALATIESSGTVFFPAGIYKITSSLNCTNASVSTGGDAVTLRGEGQRASMIIRSGSGFAMVTYNGSNGPAGNPSVYGGLIDITLNGNATSGPALQTNSAQQMFFRGVSTIGVNDVAWDLNTMQDSYFLQCTFNNCGSTSHYVIEMYGSADGTVNMMWFEQIRVETFFKGALSVVAPTAQRASNGGNNGFMFYQCKFENYPTVHGTDICYFDSWTQQLDMSGIFISAGTFDTGFSTAVNGITFGDGGATSPGLNQATFRSVFMNSGTSIGRSVLNINGNSVMAGGVTVDNITGDNTLTSGVLTVNGATGLSIDKGNVQNSAGGTLVAGDGSGTYIRATGGGSGTVTSVAVSGGTTGLTTSGGPITTTGTITLAGTLAVANGGTGSTTKNFVDLTTGQSVAGSKTFSSSTAVNNTLTVTADISAVGPQFAVIDTAAIGSSNGAGIVGRLSSAPTAASQTLAFYLGGANGANTAGMLIVSTQAHTTGSSQGTQLQLITTPNGSTTRTTALTLDQNQSATFAGDVTLADGKNISTGTTTGMKIGTATTQKLAVYNATPVVQQSATIDPAVAMSNFGIRAAGTAYPITTSGTVAFSGPTNLTGMVTAGSGGTATTQTVRTASATLSTTSAQYQVCNATSAINITLPATTVQIIFTIKNITVNTVSVVGTIDGATNYSLGQWKYVTLLGTGTSGSWYVIGNN
jgi:hypothetical protein